MSIRLRRVAGELVAVCAARSVKKPGDVYLDDEQHYALARKFALDCGCEQTNEHAASIAQEERDNDARSWWDKTYASTPHEQQH